VRELLALPGDRWVDVRTNREGALRGACNYGHINVAIELWGLTGDRLARIARGGCQPEPGNRMLASGLGDHHSPAVAAAWQAISSPGGILLNPKTGARTQQCVREGFRIFNWAPVSSSASALVPALPVTELLLKLSTDGYRPRGHS